MSSIVEQYVNSILLNITLPPCQKSDDIACSKVNDTKSHIENVQEGIGKKRGNLLFYFLDNN